METIPYGGVIASLSAKLKQVERWLIVRPPSKALDTVHQMRVTLNMIADSLIKLMAVNDTFTDGMKNDFREIITNNLEHPTKPYLIKRACRETDVDYDALMEAFDTVYYFQ